MKDPNGRHYGDGSALARRHGGAFGGSYTQIFLVPSEILLYSEKLVLNMTNQKSFPPEMYFTPKTENHGYGPGSAIIVSAIKVFCFEGHLASRCSITSKTFFINHH